jgi:hypothetical protein
MSAPKLPQPTDRMLDISTEDGTQAITPQWYQYFNAQDHGWRTRVDVLTTATTKERIRQNRVTVFSASAGVIHELDDPEIGFETTLICNIGTTRSASIIVRAATDVAIGPSGENALSFATSVSTYDHCRLVGTSTSQYHILYRTTGVTVVASS